MGKKSKILSVSIAAYNVEEYLPKVFEVLNVSDYVNDRIELIIVNDGSTDRTLEIANGYKEKFGDSVVVIDKTNGGYGSTINASIKVASGKYYKLLDGDDWFNNETIAGFVKYLEECDTDVVLSSYERHYEDRQKVELADEHSSDNLYEKILVMHEITVKTELYRLHAKPITEHCFYTDAEFSLNVMLMLSTISKYDKPVYCYRLGRSGQSVSLEGVKKHITEHDVVCKRLLKMYGEHPRVDYVAPGAFVCAVIGIHYLHLLQVYGVDGVKRVQEYDLFIRTNYKNMYDLMSKKQRRTRLSRLLHFRPRFVAYKLLKWE